MKYQFTVQGSGPFPYLAMQRCNALATATTCASAMAVLTRGDWTPYDVTLQSDSKPDPRDWEAFGWRVIAIDQPSIFD